MMRTFVFVCFLALTACSAAPRQEIIAPREETVAPRQAITREFLLGSWNLLGMSGKLVPVEHFEELEPIEGKFTFNADGTYDGSLNYPNMPERNKKVYGTYTLEGEVLTMSNQPNNTVTKADLSMRKDVLLMKPQVKNPLTVYMRRPL